MKIINQSIIKGNNLKKMYEIVLHEHSISRAAIAKKLNLSKTTVSSLVEELIRFRLVEDLGVTPEGIGVGRNPNGLGVMRGTNFAAVIDWAEGQTELRLIDVSFGNSILNRSLQITEKLGYIEATRLCYSEAKDYLAEGQKLLAVCIIVPGLIDNKQETIISTPLGINSEEGKEIVKKLRSVLQGISVCLLNDSACMACAEIEEAGLEKTDFAYINAVNGIGAAIYYNQRILGNATGVATQLGHCCVEADGPSCSCGAKGCLDAIVGENVLTERFGEFMDGVGEELSYSLLGRLAEEGNENAVKLLTRIADYFSKAIMYLVSIVYPEKIIIGGRGYELGNKFIERVKANLKNMGFQYMMKRVSVSFAKTTADDRFHGAARYFMKEHFDYSESIISGFYLG